MDVHVTSGVKIVSSTTYHSYPLNSLSFLLFSSSIFLYHSNYLLFSFLFHFVFLWFMMTPHYAGNVIPVWDFSCLWMQVSLSCNIWWRHQNETQYQRPWSILRRRTEFSRTASQTTWLALTFADSTQCSSTITARLYMISVVWNVTLASEVVTNTGSRSGLVFLDVLVLIFGIYCPSIMKLRVCDFLDLSFCSILLTKNGLMNLNSCCFDRPYNLHYFVRRSWQE